jgi:branched-chain amino acid transport system permease protein
VLLYTILAGLLFGLYFTLVGLGLNLVFGVMRVVNLAHGDFLMLGAFLSLWLFAAHAVNPLWAGPIVFSVFLVAGLPLYFALVPRLLKGRDPEMLSFILFFGFSQVIEALATIAFGTGERSMPGSALGDAFASIESFLARRHVESGPVDVLGQSFPAAWVASALASGLAVAFVYLYLYRTRLGAATRAVMVNREEAISTGIDVHRVSAVAFGTGIALAAVAGIFAPFIRGSVTPAIGVGFTVTSFAVIVIGSLGHPLGTALGGLVYGVSYMFMQTYFSSWAELLPYVLLIAILLVRPSGLLGQAVRRA